MPGKLAGKTWLRFNQHHLHLVAGFGPLTGFAAHRLLGVKTWRGRRVLNVVVALTGCLMLAVSAIMISGIRATGGWSVTDWPGAEPAVTPVAAITSREASFPREMATRSTAQQSSKSPLSARPRRTPQVAHPTPTVRATNPGAVDPSPSAQVDPPAVALVGEPENPVPASAAATAGKRTQDPHPGKVKGKKRHR